MQPERQQPWQINLHAKAKSFDFKFQVTTVLPTSKLIPFPMKLNLNLKLFPSLLQSKESELHFSIPGKGKSLKSKFLRILGKFQHRPFKNKASTASGKNSNLGHPHAHFPSSQRRHFPYEESICISLMVITGFIALLSQSQTHEKGMVLYPLIISVYLPLIVKKFTSRRRRNLLVIAIISMLCCAIWVYPSSILKINNGLWKTCIQLHSSFVQDHPQ